MEEMGQIVDFAPYVVECNTCPLFTDKTVIDVGLSILGGEDYVQ